MIGNCKLSTCSARAQASRWIGLAMMAGWAVGFAGCGDPNAAGSMKVYPVKGQVLLPDGKPLTSGRVVLVSNEKAMEFTGEVGSDGNFEIKTSYGDGAPEGTYKVRIEYDDPNQAPVKGKPSRRNVSNLPFAYEVHRRIDVGSERDRQAWRQRSRAFQAHERASHELPRKKAGNDLRRSDASWP